MEFRLLGTVDVRAQDAVHAPPRTAERCVLAVLAFNAGRPVHVDALVRAIWDDAAPPKAEQTVATHVRAVRRLIEDAGGQRDWLRNHRPGRYELAVDPTVVDYHRLVALAARARASSAAGDHRAAVTAYQEALLLWRGEPLADVATAWAEHRRYAVVSEYVDMLCGLLDSQLALGDCAAAATRVQQLINEVVPTDRMLTLGMHALAGCGRRAMIPEFVERATEIMWTTASVRPGDAVHALARRLTNDAGQVGAPVPQQTVTVDHDEPAPSASTVTMVATGNGTVYQSAGHQHIYQGHDKAERSLVCDTAVFAPSTEE